MASVISYTKERIDSIVASLTQAINGKANTTHRHSIDQVDDLTTTLANKSNVGHAHTISSVTGLQEALEAGVEAGHRHKSSDINDAATIASVLTLGKLVKVSGTGTLQGATPSLGFGQNDLVNKSYVDNKVGSTTLWVGTVAEYDAIVSKDPNRAYIIVSE